MNIIYNPYYTGNAYISQNLWDEVTVGDAALLEQLLMRAGLPQIEVDDSEGGRAISIKSDHLFGGGEPNVWAQYITRPGRQKYESYGWFNGEHLYVTVPHGVKVKSVQYRETGYNSEVVGGFECDDDYFNTYWKKTMRTLYVNMRDTYFDCPDRERAQWGGDGTLLMT